MHVVMVHGAGGGGWEWRLWANVFGAAGWSVLAPDLAPVAAGIAATRFDDYVDQVCGWCRASAQPVVVIGASLGGLLALAVANECRPAARVLVNPMPPEGIKPWPGFPTRQPIVDWSRSSFAATRAALPDASLDVVRWTHARWRDESGAVLNAAGAGILVPTTECPTLVMAAADDRDIPPATSHAVATAAAADFVSVPACSHLGILLGRQASAAATFALAWLNGCIGQPRLNAQWRFYVGS